MPRKGRPPKRYRKSPLTAAQILVWADDYNRRLARWPRHSSGRIRWTDESWLGIDAALRRGHRGLPSGSSLPNLLYVHRNVRNPRNLPPLNELEIVRWARAHFQRTQKWPNLHGGPIDDATGETWFAIDFALRRGTRGCLGR